MICDLILGSSPFTGSMTSPGATIYPPLSHMPSAFSMLEPHPMFPGAALLPFGGLGSLGEGLMSAGVLGHTLGSAGSKYLLPSGVFEFSVLTIPRRSLHCNES